MLFQNLSRVDLSENTVFLLLCEQVEIELFKDAANTASI